MKKLRFRSIAYILMVVFVTIGVLAGCGKAKPAAQTAQSQGVTVQTSAASETKAPEETKPQKETQAETRAPENTKPQKETQTEAKAPEETKAPEKAAGVKKGGEYTSKEEVAEYIHLYGELPPNYITKNEAKDLGWDSSRGNLRDVAPGKSIGGDKFGNFEKILPDVKGRKYYECDIDYTGGKRNAKRIIFSNDGQIYYTEDHYESFVLLYGDDK